MGVVFPIQQPAISLSFEIHESICSIYGANLTLFCNKSGVILIISSSAGLSPSPEPARQHLLQCRGREYIEVAAEAEEFVEQFVVQDHAEGKAVAVVFVEKETLRRGVWGK